MKLRHAAAIVPCAIALTACTAVTNTQNADLAGRSLMWADGATEECEVRRPSSSAPTARSPATQAAIFSSAAGHSRATSSTSLSSAPPAACAVPNS